MMSNPALPSVPWWRELTRYHWFVFVVAAVGWLADCMDQQLFVLSRDDAMQELLVRSIPDPQERQQQVPKYGGYAKPSPPPAPPQKKNGWATPAIFRQQQVPKYGGYATAIFLMGWAVGGLGFGV